jgi:fatty acid desaturase
MCRNPNSDLTNTACEPLKEGDDSTSINGTTIISLSELKAHNTPSSAWTCVHGKVIDITDFAKRHPGGDIILLAAGKDATVLLETYHPRGVPASLISKLQIGVIKDGDIPTSFYSWDSEFYKVLKQRVLTRLNERNLSRRGSFEIWIKAIILLISFWFSLFKMYTSTSNFYHACIWSMTMGVFAHFVGTCIQHDGSHGAFAQSPIVNTLAGWTMDMIGASAFTWQFQHMLGHHPYTNVIDVNEERNKEKGINTPILQQDQESDPDVFSSFPMMRMHPIHHPQWFHKYQHIYAPILFAFMTLAKVFQQDYEVIFNKRLYHIDAHCRYGSLWNRFRFWSMKLLSSIYMIVLPCYFHGVSKGLLLFALGHATCGEVLATMFIVNHVIEGVAFGEKHITSFPENTPSPQELSKDKTNKPRTVDGNTPMERTLSVALQQNKNLVKVPLNDWAAVQCQTSVNWSSGSWFWNHFSGGLSHQIEHHLFPSICHTNYVHIQDVVQRTCEEYGVPYQSETSLWTAYGKMLNHLKMMGQDLDKLK